MESREQLREQQNNQKHSPKIVIHKTVKNVDPQVQQYQAESRDEKMRTFESWLWDIIISCAIAFLVTALLNVLIGAGVQNNWFLGLTPQISQLWPDLMPIIAGLIALTTLLRHAPNRQ